MKDSYLACFPGGTSGRFILHVMWRTITEQDYGIKFDESNSAHPESPWWSNYFEFPTAGLDSLKSSSLFRALRLNEEAAGTCHMAFCHMFPDFDQLRIKAPNTKLVLISYNYNDIVEITTNRIRKNSGQPYAGKLVKDLIDDPVFKDLHSNDLKEYLKLYNTLPETLNDDFFSLVIDKGVKDIIRCYDIDLFTEENLTLDNIPEDFRSKTLIIKYGDIYKKQGARYVAAKQIENFLRKKIGPVTYQSYRNYVSNRTESIKRNSISTP